MKQFFAVLIVAGTLVAGAWAAASCCTPNADCCTKSCCLRNHK